MSTSRRILEKIRKAWPKPENYIADVMADSRTAIAWLIREVDMLRMENASLRAEWRRAVSRLESAHDAADNAARVIADKVERSKEDLKTIGSIWDKPDD